LKKIIKKSLPAGNLSKTQTNQAWINTPRKKSSKKVCLRRILEAVF